MRYITIISCFLGSSAAAGTPVTWGELLAPERVVHGLSQSLLLTARSFVEFTYSSLDIDLRRTSMTLRNIKAYPEIQAFGRPPCSIEVRRLELAGAGLARPEDMELTFRADDVRIASTCLPPPVVRMFEQAGHETVQIPRTVLHVSYHVPSAETRLTGHIIADDLLELSFNLDLEYLGLPYDDADAYPLVHFERGDVSLRNLGGWELVENILPPPMIDPVQGPMGVQMAVSESLNDIGAPAPFSEDLAAQMGQAWSEFLAKPDQLSIALAPGAPVYLDMETILDNPPGEVLAVLNPEIAAAPLARIAPLPTATLKIALSDPDKLSAQERLQAGQTLLTGLGAPKNVGTGLGLLLPLAQAGDEDALRALAKLKKEALSEKDYTALAGAAVDQPDIAAILDELEAHIGLAQTLSRQPSLESTVSFDGISSSQDLRARALAHLAGRQAPRSFARAAYWAQLATAVGDPIGADILADIAGRAVSAEDKEAWNTLNKVIAAQALADWIAADLPARLE
jgi:hypothetical protein